MLFNSYTFIFAFMPLTLLLFHGLRRAGFERTSIFSLVLMSLVFYGWWSIKYLFLLVPLMLANFALAACIVSCGSRRRSAAKLLLVSGLSMNLAALAYFKYANFFVDNLNKLLGLDLFLEKVVLPIGISFFIFQKIAFLVDAYRGKVERLNLLDFSLFVTFFPQLIAGPIVHHSEAMPQFRRLGSVHAESLVTGITIFAIGLAKKVLLADSVAVYATPQFAAAASGARLDLLSAWSAALSYTAQIYFDFSGYSDMAIGAALMFGIRLPLNFDSPYKSTSIIEFWRRWHITLSRFLRDYLYIPLGGNRNGQGRRYMNLVITMLLGGLWHGAGWTFVIWGALHGLYLAGNHAWHAVRKKIGAASAPSARRRRLGQIVTCLAVTVAWVFFRSDSINSAVAMLKAMAGINGLAVPASLTGLITGLPKAGGPVDSGAAMLLSFVLLAVAWAAPNTQQLTAYIGPAGIYGSYNSHKDQPAFRWQISPRWAVAVGCLIGIILMSMSKVSEFIYFQF